MRIANTEEHARLADLGSAVLGLVEAHARHEFPHATSEELSYLIAAKLFQAMMAAGNEVEWLNRVTFISGLGWAFGSVCGQKEDEGAASLIRTFNQEFVEGRDSGRATFAARGRA